MIEFPKLESNIPIPDRQQPKNIEQLIRKYDLENDHVYQLIEYIIEFILSDIDNNPIERAMDYLSKRGIAYFWSKLKGLLNSKVDKVDSNLKTYTNLSQLGLTKTTAMDLIEIINAMPDRSTLQEMLATAFTIKQFTSEIAGQAWQYATLEIIKVSNSGVYVVMRSRVHPRCDMWHAYYNGQNGTLTPFYLAWDNYNNTISKNTNGYTKLANGAIKQRGYATISGGSVNITFPTSFTDDKPVVVPVNNLSGTIINYSVSNRSATGCTIHASNTASHTVFYTADGY